MLFAIAEIELDLEAQAVRLDELGTGLLQIGTEQNNMVLCLYFFPLPHGQGALRGVFMLINAAAQNLPIPVAVRL